MASKTKQNCTIRDLAREVGLSICTVSRVLNGRGDEFKIPESTRRLVCEAADRLNYVSNINAKRMFSRKSNVIGILVPPQEEMGQNICCDNHFAGIMGGIEGVISSTQYNLMLLFNRDDYKEKSRYNSFFRSGFIDGLLIWGVHNDDHYWNDLAELTAPLMFISTTPKLESDRPINYVISDYEYAAYVGTSHLLAAGCRRLLRIASRKNTSVDLTADSGIGRALADYGLPESTVQVYHCDYFEDPAEHLIAEVLKRHEPFDGVLTANFLQARGCVNVLQSRGLPFEVVCMDSSAVERQKGDRFFTAVINDAEIGRLAMQGLLRLIENGSDSELIQTKVKCGFANVGAIPVHA